MQQWIGLGREERAPSFPFMDFILQNDCRCHSNIKKEQISLLRPGHEIFSKEFLLFIIFLQRSVIL